jgi:glycosyltransferase involved in cell wall biosynthesis
VTGPGEAAQRLGARRPAPVIPGVRVVLDARPLQAPDRAPLAAAYLEGLLGAYDAEPLAGESFVFFLRSDLPDPTRRFTHLAVVGRRLLPPTRVLRAAAMTIDPFLLRGASLGVAWRADRSGAAGAVYHVVGGGPLPIAPDLPLVATLLDLAPWEMPDVFQDSVAGRFGHRLRAQLIREAAAVVVGTEAVGLAARRLLHLKRERLRVVRVAPRPAFAVRPTRRQEHATSELRERLGLGPRYLVLTGRFDARLDHGTLLEALTLLGDRPRPADLPADVAWPPQVLLTGASPDDRASIARAAARRSIGDSLAYAPALGPEDTAGLVREARAAVLPVFADAVGLPVIEALAVGTPVVATAVGALPELVGGAGLLVPPRDPERLATALTTVWTDGPVRDGLAEAARHGPRGRRRSWPQVAAEMRAIYAAVGIGPSGRGG